MDIWVGKEQLEEHFFHKFVLLQVGMRRRERILFLSGGDDIYIRTVRQLYILLPRRL